ncbi:ABC transporter permease [Embleya scabrispora]|uniref:ABC transporter permease n=1 Tax=Embleya scabrispora TaxID=159449 RepID=UPI001785581A|nr:FtsX-like permease family protein [Embleya scabrispora]
MFFLALRTLRARKGGFAGAFVALVCAAALVTACGALLETGLRGDIRIERYAGTDTVVTADQNLHWTKHKKGKTKTKSKPLTERAWLDAAAVGKLRAVPGIEAVVPELTFSAHVLTPGGRALDTDGNAWGHAWESARLTPFTLRAGRAPAATGEVVLDADLARRAGVRVGGTVTVQAGRAPGAYRVVGIAAPPGRDALARQASVFFADADARELAGHPGQVASVGLFTAPGANPGTVRAAAREALAGTGAQLRTGTDRGPAEFPAAAKARVTLVSLGGALGGTSLLVAILVVVGTFALSIQQRRREIALLRAIGATPRQIRRMVGREALVVGLIAGALGAFAGLGLARWLHGRFVAFGALPDTLALKLSPIPLIGAVLLTLLAAWTAARVSVRRAARVRPTEALADAAIERPRLGIGRTIGGVVAALGYGVLLLVLSTLDTEPKSTPVTFLTVILAAVAIALLGPLLARAGVAVLGLLVGRLSPISGFLAARNARAAAERVAAVVTPLSLAVAMASTILFTQTTASHAAAEQAKAGTLASYSLVAGPGVPGRAAEAVRAVPGVEVATEVLHTLVRAGQDKFPAQGVTPQGVWRTLDPKTRSGSFAALADGTVAVSELAARTKGVGVGADLRITMGDGVEVTLKVIAVYERGLGFGDLTLPHAVVAAHVDRPAAEAVLVSGTAAAALSRESLQRAVGEFPGVRVLDRGEVEQARREQAGTQAQVNYVAMGLIIAFTGIAVVNTLVMATSARRREFALLQLVGTTRRQVMRMLRWETGAVVLLAAVLGSVVAYATLTAYSVGMTASASPYAPPLTYAAVLVAATGLAFVATVLPARVALRGNPADTMGLRD